MPARWWSTAEILAGCLSIALGATGCRQIVGFDEPRKTDAPFEAGTAEAASDAGAAACGLPYSTPACASCVQANCCSESSACAADVPCRGLQVCLGGCGIGDWPCHSQCAHDNPPWESPELPPLVACAVAKCDTECGLTCGDLGPFLAAPDAAARCQACFTANACANVRACQASVDCVAVQSCLSRPPTNYFCLDGGLVPLRQDALTCRSECGLGSDWSCVGHADLPGPRTGAVTLSFGKAQDLTTTLPLAGVNLSVCRFADTSCGTPFAKAATDDAGSALLYIPAANPPVTGPDSNSYAQATLAGYMTTLFFWGVPVSVPQFAPNTILDLITVAEAQMLFTPYRVTYDTTRGVLVYVVLDCSRGFANAPGVQVALDVSDPSVRQFYGTNFDFGAMQTDSFGAGGFVNVPPGAVTLTATPLALGRPSSKATVLVRANTVTWVFLWPTSTP